MTLINKQYLAIRLTERYGVQVSVGLHRWIEDIRDPDTGRIVEQIVHDEGEKYTRADGVAIPQEDIDEETERAEADEAAAQESLVDIVTSLERLTEDEVANIAQIRAANPKVDWWMLRAVSQRLVNIKAPEFEEMRTSILATGLFSAERFDEIFEP